MATSGSTDWTLTRAQVISGALRKLVVLPSGGTPSTAQTSDAAEALNAIIKAYQAKGMPVWAITNYSFTVTSGTSSYTIGPAKTLNTIATPLKVLQASRTLSGGINTAMNVYNRYDFNILPTNTSTVGVPVNLYYQPTITNGVPTGIIQLWPIPNDSTTLITIDYQRPFEDMDNTGDALDFPSYWINALIYTLAWTLAPEYGIPPTDRNVLRDEAKFWVDEALSYGSEEGSITFQPGP